MPVRNLRYPHLLPFDIPVWERFLETTTYKYIDFDYDVRVGEGRTPPDDVPDNIKQMAYDLSLRRIDAVGRTASEIHIIEITRSAGLKAVGQLVAYPLLYSLTYHPTQPLVKVLVCETIQTDILPAIIAQDILLEIV